MKYINNTGEMYPSPSVGVSVDREVYSEIFMKACGPFSHVNSKGQKGKVIVLDIQGAGFNLTDPELSSLQLSLKTADGHQELLLGGGNQGQKGIQYCQLLGLNCGRQQNCDNIQMFLFNDSIEVCFVVNPKRLQYIGLLPTKLNRFFQSLLKIGHFR